MVARCVFRARSCWIVLLLGLWKNSQRNLILGFGKGNHQIVSSLNICAMRVERKWRRWCILNSFDLDVLWMVFGRYSPFFTSLYSVSFLLFPYVIQPKKKTSTADPNNAISNISFVPWLGLCSRRNYKNASTILFDWHEWSTMFGRRSL